MNRLCLFIDSSTNSTNNIKQVCRNGSIYIGHLALERRKWSSLYFLLHVNFLEGARLEVNAYLFKITNKLLYQYRLLYFNLINA